MSARLGSLKRGGHTAPAASFGPTSAVVLPDDASAEARIKVVIHDWRGGRYGAHPECSLLASPRSEDGACDTDVQTLGKADVLAHTSLMDGMYTI